MVSIVRNGQKRDVSATLDAMKDDSAHAPPVK
jgi:hypothetical protein